MYVKCVVNIIHNLKLLYHHCHYRYHYYHLQQIINYIIILFYSIILVPLLQILYYDCKCHLVLINYCLYYLLSLCGLPYWYNMERRGSNTEQVRYVSQGALIPLAHLRLFSLDKCISVYRSACHI